MRMAVFSVGEMLWAVLMTLMFPQVWCEIFTNFSNVIDHWVVHLS